MAQSRDEIVANFQGITAIDDVAVALQHLENANWDLLTAINRVVPQDGPFSSSSFDDRARERERSRQQQQQQMDPDVQIIEDGAGASTSERGGGPSNRFIDVRVRYGDRTHHVWISRSSTVGDLRSKIYDATGVLPCRQILDGLGSRFRMMPSPNATLASLRLDDACDVFLAAPEEQNHDDGLADRLAQTYVLNVENEGKHYKLRFPGTHTVLQVKEDVSSFTSFAVRHQQWTGWPSVPDLDNKALAMIGISYPEHNLTVKKVVPRSLPKRQMDTSESEDSDNYEDAVVDEDLIHVDDDLLDVTKKDEPLIPDNTEDEAVGCFLFADRFKERYGSSHPLFFQGSLDDAIKESCLKPAKDRRLLGIYLHHEASILSNVFCTQLLIDESVLSILAANFLVYGWDLTFESNKNMLLSSVSNALGTQASMTVKNIPLDRLPVLIIIMRIRSSTEIYTVIDGNVSLEELVGKLMEGVDRWSSRRNEEIDEEQAREARQRVKWEQDEAYRQSLEADRAKEEAKKRQEMAENKEKKRVEDEKQAIEAKREIDRISAQSRLPLEPENESGENITKIRVRLPEGRSLERRFTADTPLQALFDFLTVNGYPFEDYKIISSWPRRDLTTLDCQLSFKALNLYPQESVMLEARSNE